jgi:hypothetical protein
MLQALSLTNALAPAVRRKPCLRGLGPSHFKAWLRRHDVEVAIRSLKEHINKCLLQFTVSDILG